jgi:hypothetical protein
VLRKMFSLAVMRKMRTDDPATSFRKRPECRGICRCDGKAMSHSL